MTREFSIQQIDKIEYFEDFCNSDKECCNWVCSKAVHCMFFKENIDRLEHGNLKRCSAYFKPGNDVSIVNSNADTGEILLSHEYGTQITKTFDGKAALNVVDADGLKVSKPANFIEDIAYLVSVNPIAFLTANNKSRANILLEAMPLKVTKGIIKETVGQDIDIRNIENRHAFEVLGELHKVIYDLRTAKNRLVKLTEADIISADSNNYAKALDNIQELKGKLLSNLPIPGLEIIGRVSLEYSIVLLINSNTLPALKIFLPIGFGTN